MKLTKIKQRLITWLDPEYNGTQETIQKLRKEKQELSQQQKKVKEEIKKLVKISAKDSYKPVDFDKFYAAYPPGYTLPGNTIEEQINNFRKLTWTANRLILQQRLQELLTIYETN